MTFKFGIQSPIKWHGPGVYQVPWRREQIHVCTDAETIAKIARTPHTRSRLIRGLLARFGMSENSVVSADDGYVQRMKPILMQHMPSQQTIDAMAQEIVQALGSSPASERHLGTACTEVLLKAMYLQLLEHLLGIEALKPLTSYIQNQLTFARDRESLITQATVYSMGLNATWAKPLRALVDRLLFPSLHTKQRMTHQLFEHVRDFSVPKADGLYAHLLMMHQQGAITTAQLEGEVTAIVISAHSIASSAAAVLLCLACQPQWTSSCTSKSGARRFVMEVLRLYPPLRIFGYESPDASSASQDVWLVDLQGLHQNPQLWDKPKQFNPDRFLEPGAAAGFKYLPFGMGKRACPGRALSMNLLQALLQKAAAHLVLTQPNNYRGDHLGMPLHGKGMGPLFLIEDDRLQIWTREEAAHRLETQKNDLRAVLHSRFKEFRPESDFASARDLWLHERQVEEASEHLAGRMDLPHPLLQSHALAHQTSLDQAAQSILDHHHAKELALIESEQIKAKYLADIAHAEDVRALEEIRSKILLKSTG